MPITEVGRDEYLATIQAPMRCLDPAEVAEPVPISGYIAGCVQAYQHSANLDAVEIENVYLSGNQVFVGYRLNKVPN